MQSYAGKLIRKRKTVITGNNERSRIIFLWIKDITRGICFVKYILHVFAI